MIRKKMKVVFAIILTIVMTMTIVVPVDAKTYSANKKVYVTNQKELNAALKNSAASTIIIKTKKKLNLNIGKNKRKANLVVDAPNAKISNNSKFKRIEIKNLAKFVEKSAKGNNIVVKDKKLTLTIEKNAKGVTVKAYKIGANLDINVKGRLKAFEISKKAQVNIKGSTNQVIPINVNAKAKIETSVKTQIQANASVYVIFNKGAEESNISTRKDVSVYVKNETKGKISIKDKTGKKYKVDAGKEVVCDKEGITEKKDSDTSKDNSTANINDTGSTTRVFDAIISAGTDENLKKQADGSYVYYGNMNINKTSTEVTESSQLKVDSNMTVDGNLSVEKGAYLVIAAENQVVVNGDFTVAGNIVNNGDITVNGKLIITGEFTNNGNITTEDKLKKQSSSVSKTTEETGSGEIIIKGKLTHGLGNWDGAATDEMKASLGAKIVAKKLTIKEGEIEILSEAYISADEIVKDTKAKISFHDYAAKISFGLKTKSNLSQAGIEGVSNYSLSDKDGYMYYGPAEDGKCFVYSNLLSFAGADESTANIKVNPKLSSDKILFRGMTYDEDSSKYIVILNGFYFSSTNKVNIENAKDTIILTDNTSADVTAQYTKYFTTNGDRTVLITNGYEKLWTGAFLGSEEDNGIIDLLKIDTGKTGNHITFANSGDNAYIKIEGSAEWNNLNLDLANNAIEVTDGKSLSLVGGYLKGTGNSSTKDMLHLSGTGQINLGEKAVIECDATETGASVFSGDSSSSVGVVNFKDMTDINIIFNSSSTSVPLVKGSDVKVLSQDMEDAAGRFVNTLLDFGDAYNGVKFNNNDKSDKGLEYYLGYELTQKDGKYTVSFVNEVKPKEKTTSESETNMACLLADGDTYSEEKSSSYVSEIVINEGGKVLVTENTNLKGYIIVKAGARLTINSDVCLNMMSADSDYNSVIIVETGGELEVNGELKTEYIKLIGSGNLEDNGNVEADIIESTGEINIHATGRLEVKSLILGTGADTSMNGVLKVDEIKNAGSSSSKPVIKCCVSSLSGDINDFSVITKNSALNSSVKFIKPSGDGFSSAVLGGDFGTESEQEVNIANYSFKAGDYYYYSLVYNDGTNNLYFITPNMLRAAIGNTIVINTSLVGTVKDDYSYNANENNLLYFLGEENNTVWALDLCDSEFSTLSTNKVIPIYNDNVVLRYKDESIRTWVYMKNTANRWLQVNPCVLEESSGVKYSNPFGGGFYKYQGPKIESTLDYAISMKDETTKYIKVLNYESVYIDGESEIDLSDVPLVVEGSATKTTTLYINTNIKGKGNSDIGCLIELSSYANLNIGDNCKINVDQKNIKTVIDNSYNTTSIKNNIEFGNNSLISASQGIYFIGKNVNDSYIEEQQYGMDGSYLYRYDTTNGDEYINVLEMTNLGYSIKPDTCEVVIKFTQDDDGICKVQRTS